MLANHGKMINGSRIAVDLKESADASEIREACYIKQKAYNNNLMVLGSMELEVFDFELCYKSMEVATHLPGTKVAMRLDNYKQAVGLPYSQITFVLNCKASGNVLNLSPSMKPM